MPKPAYFISAPQQIMKQTLTFAAKLGLTLALFYWVSRSVDFAAAKSLLLQARPEYIALNMLLILASHVLSGVRWWAVAQGLKIPEPLRFFLKYILIGQWFNQILPSGVGGDGIRMLALRKYLKQGAVTSVLLERGAGLVMLLCMIAISLTLSPMLLGNHPAIMLLWALVVGGLAAAVLYGALGDRLPLNKIPGLGRLLHKAPGHMRQLLVYDTRRAAVIWGTSALIQILAICHFFVTARALNLELPFWVFVALIPPVNLLLLVPLTFAGWGLREGAIISLFTAAALLDANAAGVLSILFGLQVLAAASIGGVLLLARKA